MDRIRTDLREFSVENFFESKGISICDAEKERIIRSIKALTTEKYSIYGHMQEDFVVLWTEESHIVDTRLAYLYEIIFTEIVVPKLSEDFERNRLPIAYALCYVDSAKLDPITRSNMGLTSLMIVQNPPDLFRLNHTDIGDQKWMRQCPDASNIFIRDINSRAVDLIELINDEWRYEKYDEDTDEYLKSFDLERKIATASIAKSVPIVVFNTLILKRLGMINALCTETTEVKSHGRNIVFIKDVFYGLRTLSLVKLLEKGEHDIDNLPFSISYEEGFDVIDGRLVNAILTSEDFGGIWQPTVQFFHHDSMIMEG